MGTQSERSEDLPERNHESQMPPLPVIASCFRVALTWETPGTAGHAVNVIHVASDTHDKEAIPGVIDTHWTRSMIDTVSASAKVVRMSVLPLDGTSGAFETDVSTNIKWQGNGGSDWVPALATIIKLRTGLRGRSHRGRIFLPYTGETVQGNGTLSDATVTSMTTAWETFRTSMSADDCALVVASYVLAEATQLTSCSCEKSCGTQRRRQDRVRAA